MLRLLHLLLIYLRLSCLVDSFTVTGRAPKKGLLLQATDTSGENARAKDYSVVVVGGGWAGFSSASAISSSSNVQVTLLDASPRGAGGLAGGWSSPVLNKTVEVGIHGFWRRYDNTFETIRNEIGIDDLDDILTPFQPSTLVAERGKVAVAPVLGESTEETSATSAMDGRPSIASLLPNLSYTDALASELGPLLPPPLDVALLTEFEKDSCLTTRDRISGIGLLPAWADFGQEDRESWMRYDSISAENLFRSIAGVTPNLYQEVVSPLLHVLPMTPGYDCSAAAALSCFHVFALQARGAFDVRWCRGSLTEKIFNPWIQKLQSRGNVRVQGSSKVTAIDEAEGGEKFIVTVNDGEKTIECDAVVLAVGATTAGRMIDGCAPLQSIPSLASQWKRLRGVTCVAVRLFLTKSAGDLIKGSMTDSSVLVCGPNGNIPTLSETGFCIYDLGRLQDEFSQFEADEGVSTFEVDFFRAGDLADKDDSDVLEVSLAAISTSLGLHEDVLDHSAIVDSSVVRARNAVSHFCVGSAALSPQVARLSPVLL